MMSYFPSVALLNAITSGLTFLFIFFNNPKTKTNRYFSYYAFCVTLWAVFQLFWITAQNKSEALFYVQLSLLSALFIPPTFLHFTCHLINDYRRHARIIKGLYIFSLIMVPINFTSLYIAGIQPMLKIYNWPIAGKTFVLYFLDYILGVAYALFIIYKKLKSTSGIQQQQLKYIFYGILLAYLGGSTNFPLCFHINILPFGNIFVPIYTIFITYAIFKYQLMDINIVLKRSLVYTLLITIITLFYLLSIYSTEHILQTFIGYKSIFISMTYATIIALAFIPLKNLIQNFVEKILFRGSYVQIAEENELLRQEVMQTEKLKSIAILASGMAHEIKNPLTLLKTFSEFLPSKVDDKAFLKKFSPMVAHEINRIDELVHNLLDFAKPAPPALKPTNIHQLLNHTLDLLSNDLIKHHIQCVRQYHPDGRCLDIDPQQISQAILNIVLNAIEAMPSGGTLTVSTSVVILSPKGEESKGTLRSFVPTKSVGTQDDRITIKIQDTGYGISPEHLPHIFDPFFTQKDHGTGLGLSITHEIIRHHQGRIFVESQTGKGTTFIIDLPLS